MIAIVDLELQGIVMNVEHSDDQFPGLSHREWCTTRRQQCTIETLTRDKPRHYGSDVVNDPVNPLALAGSPRTWQP